MSMQVPLSQSPRTQGFQAPESPEDEDELFAKGLTELAYRAMQKSQPELISEIITFRIIDANAEEGRGLGVFILNHQQDILFVPCVVSDNAVKPLDLFYSRSTDQIYPLTSGWLREATKNNINQLGSGVRPPRDMPTDVDIRNLVVPPATGRYAYASADEDWDTHAHEFIERLLEKEAADATAPAPPTHFLALLEASPPHVKLGFARALRGSKKMAENYAAYYGKENLLAILRPSATKTAKEKDDAPSPGFKLEVPMKHDVFLATTSTPAQEMKARLGPEEAALAYKSVHSRGFYVKDERKGERKDLFSYAESDLQFIEPSATGLYDVWLSDGSVERAIVIAQPFELRHKGDEQRTRDTYYETHLNDSTDRKYVVLLSGGRWAEVRRLIAQPVTTESQKDVEDFIRKNTEKAPTNKSHGVLIATYGMATRGSFPVYAHDVSSNGPMTTFEADGVAVTINALAHGVRVIRPQNSKSAILSGDFRWWKCTERLLAGAIVTSSNTAMRLMEAALLKKGAKALNVKKAGDHYVVAGQRLPRLQAAVKIATEYDLSIPKSVDVLTAIDAQLPTLMYAVKVADGESLNPDGSPMQAPQAPAGPSGIDLATSEKIQQIDAQMAALQGMKAMLSEVQARAQAIDSGGGAMAAPAAAASMAAGPGMLQGQPVMAPPAPQQPDPAQGQGMALSQGGAPAPGGAPPPPNAELPPPPVMPAGEVSADSVASQVNPEYADQAASLNDANIFDAVAVSSLARTKQIGETIQNYLPALDRALDNLGRIVLLFYVKESEIREAIGNEKYTESEQKLRDTFKGLGESLLDIGQYADQLGKPLQQPVR